MVEMEQEGTKFLNVNRHDTLQEKLAPIIFSGLIILMMLGIIAAGIWAFLTKSAPLLAVGFSTLIPAGMIMLIVRALLQRMKEIEGGEEDAARKY